MNLSSLGVGVIYVFHKMSVQGTYFFLHSVAFQCELVFYRGKYAYVCVCFYLVGSLGYKVTLCRNL